MKMSLTDTHAHVYLPEFKGQEEAVLARAFDSGISKILMPNVDEESLEPMLALCEQYAGRCFPMIGLHPTSVDNTGQDRLMRIMEQRDRYSFCAIGEIGIDLYWDSTYIEEQICVFEDQLRLSIEWDLPVVIHARQAHPYILDSLHRVGSKRLRGVFHSFCETSEVLDDISQLDNFFVGINGIVTFKNSSLAATLRSITPQKILLETDAPYLAPVPYRGKTNEPMYIWETAKKLAEIYSMELPSLLQNIEDNVESLFNL